MEYYSGIQKVLKYLKSFSNFYVNVKGFPRLCLFKALWKVKVARFEERFDLSISIECRRSCWERRNEFF